jgi:hypothetical protein
MRPLPHRGRVDPEDDPHNVIAEVHSGVAGAFRFSSLTGSDGAPRSLLRGWEYELRAEAPGFFGSVAIVDFAGGEEAVVLEIEVIDDELVHGDGGLFVGEQPPGRLKDVEGTLVQEVLRRLGRQGPDGRPTR